MTCCKADEFKWCSELEAECQDEEGNKYCIFHAPVGCKGKVDKEEFESLVFQRIDEAIKNGGTCELSGTVFQWAITFVKYDNEYPFPPIRFKKAFFNKIAEFHRTNFSGVAIFHETTFNDKTSFLRNTFNDKVLFGDSSFSKNVTFNNTTFNDETIFDKTEFNDTADFFESTFNNEASFWKSTFKDIANFWKVSFNGKTDFRDNTFSGYTRFERNNFNDKVLFKGSSFSKKVSFWKTTFNGKVHFFETTFSNKVDITFAFFQAIAEFEKTAFMRGVNFSMSVFSDIVFLRHTEFGDTTNFNDNIVDRYLVFDSVGMEYVSLKGTNVSSFIVSMYCTWPKVKDFIWYKRKAVYDDCILTKESKPEEYESVALVYRQFKQGQKENHNEAGASIWHYGEKEMFRKERWWRSWPISITFWYWLSSGYGERPVRAGVFLAGLFILLIGILNIVGLTDGSSSIKGFSGPFNLASFLILIKTSLQYALFVKAPSFEPTGNFGSIILLIITRLFLPIQAALFGFALRNRFRR